MWTNYFENILDEPMMIVKLSQPLQDGDDALTHLPVTSNIIQHLAELNTGKC